MTNKSKKEIEKSCGKEMGYRHLSGAKAYCGDDVGTHIIYCERCAKKYLIKLNEKRQNERT